MRSSGEPLRIQFVVEATTTILPSACVRWREKQEEVPSMSDNVSVLGLLGNHGLRMACQLLKAVFFR